MKILSYSGETVVVSDRMGDAVVDYAKALAGEIAADVIDIAVTGPDGPGIARLLIGPSSQLISLSSSEPEVDLHDAATIEDIRSRIRRLSPVRSYAARADTWNVDLPNDLDYL